MINAWNIVASVQEKFRGLPTRMAAMNGKTAEWYSSHSREPKTQNPLSSGNVSEVEHFMRYVRKCEGAMRGAGSYLNNLVHKELQAEIIETASDECSQIEMECEVIDEVADVSKWLIRFDIENATRSQLVAFQDECNQAANSIEKAKAHARARQRQLESETNIRDIGRDAVAKRRVR